MTNAKLYRNLIRAGVVAAALGHVALSHAAYATLNAPVGWSPGVGAAATYSTGVSAAQEASIALARINANAALSVGGRSVAIPVTMPIVKEGIKKAAAVAIFAHPALRTAAQVATWLGAAGLLYDAAKGWQRVDPSAEPSTGYLYRVQGSTLAPKEPAAACKEFYAGASGNGYYYQFQSVSGTAPRALYCQAKYGYSPSGPFDYAWSNKLEHFADTTCPAGWYRTSAGCVSSPPMQNVDKDGFVRILEPDPRVDVDGLPNIVWPASWPVSAPQVQPTFVPTGNPAPNPNYDPSKPQSTTNQPFTQPGVNVAPAPTTSNPWQVDIQPVNRPVSSPEAKPEPTPNVNPDGSTKPDPGDQQRDPKDEDKQDLCEKHPDILACQKVDTEVPDDKIPKAQKSITFAPENTFGGGSCPADQYATVGGQQLKVVDWSRDCQYIVSNVRPLAFAITALIVAGILVGALKP